MSWHTSNHCSTLPIAAITAHLSSKLIHSNVAAGEAASCTTFWLLAAAQHTLDKRVNRPVDDASRKNSTKQPSKWSAEMLQGLRDVKSNGFNLWCAKSQNKKGLKASGEIGPSESLWRLSQLAAKPGDSCREKNRQVKMASRTNAGKDLLQKKQCMPKAENNRWKPD